MSRAHKWTYIINCQTITNEDHEDHEDHEDQEDYKSQRLWLTWLSGFRGKLKTFCLNCLPAFS